MGPRDKPEDGKFIGTPIGKLEPKQNHILDIRPAGHILAGCVFPCAAIHHLGVVIWWAGIADQNRNYRHLKTLHARAWWPCLFENHLEVALDVGNCHIFVPADSLPDSVPDFVCARADENDSAGGSNIAFLDQSAD